MIESPCTSMCRYADDKDVCIGCLRTKEEIQKWLFSDDEYKVQVLKNIEERSKEKDDYERYV